MDVKRASLTEAEQDWIDKYRAALDKTPIPTSRFSQVRKKLSGARRAFATGMTRIFGSQRKAVPAATANSNLQASKPRPQTSPSELRKLIAQDALAQEAWQTREQG